jgi:PAS domain S-box-containing protein
MKTIRVLLIEDVENDALLITRQLEKSGFSLQQRRVENADAFKEAIATEQWDLILADYSLPDFGALPALQIAKEMGLDIPFIIVTGTISDELAVAAMKAGADDYVMKDRLGRLVPAVEKELREAGVRRDRKRAKERENLANAKLVTVVDILPDLFYIKDTEGRYQTVNPSFEQFVGKPKSGIIGKLDSEIWPEEVFREIRRLDSQILATRKPCRYEHVLTNAEGTFSFDTTKAPLLDAAGEVAGIVGFSRDMTALRRSETTLKSIMDNIGIGIAVISPQMEVLAVNPQMREWNPQTNFTGRTICFEAFNDPPRNAVCSYCAVVKTLRDGLVHDVVTSTPSGDKIRHFRINASPIKSHSGEVTAVIEMVEDITEQILAQEEIRKLSQAIEQSPIPVIITDTDGKIEYVNPKFSAVTGYSPSEVLGRTPAILKSGTQDDSVYAALWRTITAGGEFVAEFNNKTKDGGLYWALASVSPLRNGENQITHYLGIQQDITERKRMESDLHDKNDRLEETLKQLKQIQMSLIQHEKLAGIGQLAAGVAHEINNPLGFVISNFAILKKYCTRLQDMIAAYRDYMDVSLSVDDARRIQAADRMRRYEQELKIAKTLADLPDLLSESTEGLERVGAIVKGLRLFSRVDSDHKFGIYELNAGIETTLMVAKNEIKYVAEVATELTPVPAIEAVGSEINQVLLNLLVNAAQAIQNQGKEGAGEIRIKTYADENYVYCEIADNGGGIIPGNEKKVFEPFFTTKPVGQGTGLGLSISYDIVVNRHHGQILMQNRYGEGVTFTVRLPITQSTRPKICD